ncbi:hypothetical protein FBUS_11442 [Fasciolopsis buskii]|uniref:Trematode Eggshell Synthesis n=1 Tax=Fasciolopsis buskii TaxID=27845 RepID=A0A8E0RX20_9TREM|nr:hypothetical protein FBUS_11442 [Fasciolopsis buski]
MIWAVFLWLCCLASVHGHEYYAIPYNPYDTYSYGNDLGYGYSSSYGDDLQIIDDYSDYVQYLDKPTYIYHDNYITYEPYDAYGSAISYTYGPYSGYSSYGPDYGYGAYDDLYGAYDNVYVDYDTDVEYISDYGGDLYGYADYVPVYGDYSQYGGYVVTKYEPQKDYGYLDVYDNFHDDYGYNYGKPHYENWYNDKPIHYGHVKYDNYEHDGYRGMRKFYGKDDVYGKRGSRGHLEAKGKYRLMGDMGHDAGYKMHGGLKAEGRLAGIGGSHKSTKFEKITDFHQGGDLDSYGAPKQKYGAYKSYGKMKEYSHDFENQKYGVYGDVKVKGHGGLHGGSKSKGRFNAYNDYDVYDKLKELGQYDRHRRSKGFGQSYSYGRGYDDRKYNHYDDY